MLPAVALLLLAPCGVARADPEPPRRPSAGRRAAAAAASLLPGALVHGSGHFVLGDRRTARRLLYTEAVGLGLVAAGGAAFGGSGTDESLAVLYVPLLVGGTTLVIGSFLADLLGVAAEPIARASTGPPDPLAAGGVAAVSMGARWVGHPALDLGFLATTRGGLRLSGLSLALSTELDLRGRYRGYSVEAAHRLPWRPGGGALSVGVDGAWRRLSADRITSTPVALWVEGVWPLGLARLPGAYARGRLGLGVERCDYHQLPDADDDLVPLVVAGAGLGLRLGPVDLELDYDQRKDGFPGGIYLGRLPGFLGSVGATARLPLVHRLWLTGSARYGTGATAWLALARTF